MDSTHEFVKKVHDTQDKDKRNKEHQGKGTPSDQLSNKQHTKTK
jgi:hypothetical protein